MRKMEEDINTVLDEELNNCIQKLRDATFGYEVRTFITEYEELMLRKSSMITQKFVRDFQKAIGKVRAQYKKRGQELFWIRNIERGTKGGWHIHLVVNEIGDTASILQKAWKKGGTWFTEIRKSKFYDEDFTKLANYMTKSERTVELKVDGTQAKPRIKEASYNISRNMPLPEPEKQTLVHWPKEPKPKKGYYIAKIHEGINPVTGYSYRRYTLIRLGKDLEENKNRKQRFRKKRRRKREQI